MIFFSLLNTVLISFGNTYLNNKEPEENRSSTKYIIPKFKMIKK